MAFDSDEQLSIVPTVAELSAHMIATFNTWSEDDWYRDSYCAGWSRADVVAHITTGTDYRTQVLKLGLADNPIFPWGATSLNEVRNIRARAVENLCSGGPKALLDGFTQVVNQHQEVLASLQPSDLGKMAQYPRGLVPIGEWIGMQLIELIVHEWGMRRPDEPRARLVAFAVEPVLKVLPETHMRFLSHRLADNDSIVLQDGVYRVCAGSAAWAFRVRNQGVTYEEGLTPSWRTSFNTDPETLILLSRSS